MLAADIQKFLDSKTTPGESCVKIEFPKRAPVYGLFVQDKDYNDLRLKNFWRIVTRPYFEAWYKTKDMNLAKIFNGAEFSRLSLDTE